MLLIFVLMDSMLVSTFGWGTGVSGQECLQMGKMAVASCPEHQDGISQPNDSAGLRGLQQVQQIMRVLPYTDARTGLLYKNKTIYDCNHQIDHGVPWRGLVTSNSTPKGNNLVDLTRDINLNCVEFLFPESHADSQDIPDVSMPCTPETPIETCRVITFNVDFKILLSLNSNELNVELGRSLDSEWLRYTCDVTEPQLLESSQDIDDVKCAAVMGIRPRSGQEWDQLHGLNIGVGITFAKVNLSVKAHNVLPHLWDCYLDVVQLQGLVPVDIFNLHTDSRRYSGNTAYISIHEIITTASFGPLDMVYWLNTPDVVTEFADFHSHLIVFLQEIHKRSGESSADIDVFNSDLCFWVYDLHATMPKVPTFCIPKVAYSPVGSLPRISDDKATCIQHMPNDSTVWFTTAAVSTARATGNRIDTLHVYLHVSFAIMIMVWSGQFEYEVKYRVM